MGFYWTKVLLATALLAAGCGAAFSMLRVLGKPTPPADPLRLRRVHRIAGRTFVTIALVLGTLGILHWTKLGDIAPLRAVIHATLALALITVFLLKIVIVKVYRQFLRLAPALGMSVFAGTLVLFLSSAGYYLLRTAQRTPSSSVVDVTVPDASGDQVRGRTLFEHYCAECHFPDREEKKVGPGLKNLLRKPTLPVSGKPATVESVLHQLRTPYSKMPAFPSLAGRNLSDLMAYLKSL